MQFVDWLIIGTYFAGSAAVGIYFTRRAGRSTQEFFLSGRNLPWWLAGTSMVATTFAADTPLAVTELVAKNGVAGNWLWWNFVMGAVLTVFFFARLWRRAGIMTDVEFVELRYSGKPAAFLRGFRSLYLGIFMNCIVPLSWASCVDTFMRSGPWRGSLDARCWSVAARTERFVCGPTKRFAIMEHRSRFQACSRVGASRPMVMP